MQTTDPVALTNARRVSLPTNNTVYRRDSAGTMSVELHGTEVVRFRGRHILLNSGGHRTVTTKRRMNEVSKFFGLGFTVSQTRGEWHVNFKGKSIPFRDGMKLTL